jgi:hypothetical protein
MNFLLTELQVRILIESQNPQKLTEYVKNMNSFSKNVIEVTSKKYDLNLKSLAKWGASMGGLLLPISEFIKGKDNKLSEFQLYLILAGIGCSYFTTEKPMLNKIISKIKEEKLVDIFTESKKKTDLLKKSFTDFMKSLDVIDSDTNILPYTFLIPIVIDIKNLNSSSESYVEQILNSGVIDVSPKKLDSIFKKIIKKKID